MSRIDGPAGNTIFATEVEGERVLDTEVTHQLSAALGDVIRGGTGRRAAIDRPAAGKTGTSTRNRDAWFCGYTPQLSAAVWMGSPKGQVSMRSVGGITVFGGTYPARIWAAFMQAALEGEPVLEFTPPNPKRWPRSRPVSSNNRIAVSTTTSLLPFDPALSPFPTGPELPPTAGGGSPTLPPPGPPVTSPPPTAPT